MMETLQVCLMITGACCWLFWLCCYMSQVGATLMHCYRSLLHACCYTRLSQMNPLIGPILETKALFAMKLQWDGGEE
jgi:hypothetical protein